MVYCSFQSDRKHVKRRTFSNFNKDLYRAVFENMNTALSVLDFDLAILEVNQQECEMYGYTREELLGQRIHILFPSEIVDQISLLCQPLQEKKKISFETEAMRKDGTRVSVSVIAKVINIPKGGFILISSNNFAEQVNGTLGQSKEIAQAIVDTSVDGIITIDERGIIGLFNKAAERIFGYQADEVIGKNVSVLMPPPYSEEHNHYITNYLRTGKKKIIGIGREVVGQRKDGTVFPIDLAVSEVGLGEKRIFTGVVRDITQRKQIEEKLREQAALLDHAQDAILVRDLEDRILFWNKGAERMYGWTAEEVIGRNIQRLLYNKETLPQFEEADKILVEKGKWTGELHQITKDGKEIIVEGRWTLICDDKGKPKSKFVINTDITARKKLEAQFLRAQRMESIGTLASGIAHDLNNVLAPITLALKILQRKFTDEQSQRLIETLRTSAERGASIVNQVLSFARGIEGERIVIQPGHLIKEIEKILHETLPKSIQIQTGIPKDLYFINGDATQLYQVLMNLCVNARDAMPNGGKLTIEAENIYLDENYARMHLEAKPGQFVLIKVRDTGIGIPAAIIDKIFEPFFTTKEHRKGTGLGLSTVLAIVKGHNGFINVYSEVGKGTQFEVYLPAVETVQPGQVEKEQPELPVGHGEWVLVVDDETSIREITKETLETYGYRVLTASDGAEAVALYAENKKKINVVLLDLMMPYMDGLATIRALQRLDSNVRIIASSGLKANGKSEEIQSTGVKTFLLKPYTAEKLLTALAKVLSVK